MLSSFPCLSLLLLFFLSLPSLSLPVVFSPLSLSAIALLLVLALSDAACRLLSLYCSDSLSLLLVFFLSLPSLTPPAVFSHSALLSLSLLLLYLSLPSLIPSAVFSSSPLLFLSLLQLLSFFFFLSASSSVSLFYTLCLGYY